jgi:hypothetical protein
MMARVLELLSNRRSVRLATIAGAALILAASASGLWYSSIPAEAQESDVTHYQHRGQFDYTVYVNPGVLYGDQFELPGDAPTAQDPSEPSVESSEMLPVFFRELLKELDMSLTFEVECDHPIRSVHTETVISVVAEHPRLWRKEMRTWTDSGDSGQLRIDFPVDFELLEFGVKKIEDEIGINRTQSDFVIEAHVRAVGETLDGQAFDEEFTHSVRMIVKDTTLELSGDLMRAEQCAIGDSTLTMKGRFDYEAYMTYSSLYDSQILRSEPLPVAAPEAPVDATLPPRSTVTLGPGQVLYPSTIQSIDAVYAYDFSCDKLIDRSVREVVVTATLSSGDSWAKTLTLVPSSTLEMGSISFPVDIPYFDCVVAAIGEQTGVRTGSYDFSIEARVHARAWTAGGIVDEFYSQVLSGRRDGAQLTFNDGLSNTKEGALGGAPKLAVSEHGTLRSASLFGVSAGVLALAILGVVSVRGGRRSEAEKALARARRQFRESLIEVREVPPAGEGEVSVALATLDDVARVAEQAGKPVLCVSGTEALSFVILDGRVRYIYTLKTGGDIVPSAE